MENGYTYSNREMIISFKKHAHVHFVSPQSFNSGSFKGFFDWLLGFQDHSTTIRLPYHMIVLSEEGEETSITYMEDTQTQIWNISSRVIQENLVQYSNNMFETNDINGVKWIPQSDGTYNHADYMFSSSGNFGTIIPVSGSLSHTQRSPYKDGAY